MSFNGSGVFVINSAGQPVVATTLITAAAHNALTADLATGLSNCITKDGQTTITQNIPFNDKKITGLGAGTALTDAASLATIQNGTGVYVGTVGGTADVITLTPSPAITAYAAGQTFRFIASGANTTNVTVAVSGLAAKALTKNGATALFAGDIPSGTIVSITYDGTRFQLGTPDAMAVASSLFSLITPADNIFRVVGSADATKKLAFEVDGITTGTTRTLTMPNANLTLPVVTAGGDLVVAAGAGVLSKLAIGTTRQTLIVNAGATLPEWAYLATLATEQATTSGSSIEFIGIPVGVRRITIMLVGVSLTGASSGAIELGDNGGYETSGYTSTLATLSNGVSPVVQNATSSFFVFSSTSGANVFDGIITLCLENASSNTWVLSSTLTASTTAIQTAAGSKSLSATLDDLRIFTPGVFDAGTINISYE